MHNTNLKTGGSTIKTTKKDKKIKTKSGIKPELFEEPPAYVSYSSGLNYGTKKITITRPCKNDDEEIDKTFKNLVKDVEDKLSKMKDNNCGIDLDFINEDIKSSLNEGK